jgi:Chaperone of endosialidase
MASFWDTLGSVFGGGQSGQGADTQGAAAGQAGEAAKTLGGVAGQDQGQMAQNAIAAGQKTGEQQGKMTAEAATQQALQAARGSGLNAGQAAQQAAGQAGQAYTGGNIAGRQLGTGAYQTATGQRIGAAQGQAAAAGTQAGVGQGQQEMGQKQSQSLLGGIGSLATGIAGLFSDEKLKENITPAPEMLDQIIRKIKPKAFDYKEGDKGQVGVTAQNLEQTPLAPTVQDTPHGKMIDTGKLSAANLDLIVELGNRLKALEDHVGIGRKQE